MKTIIMEPNFDKVEADVLVIGVPEHPENITGWDDFVSSFSTRLPEWVKSGDIKTEFKSIVKMPSVEVGGYKRVFFIGLGLQKEID